MAITTTRFGTIVDKLVAALQASSTFADPVKVYDGPTTGGDTMWTQAVFVGFDGDWRSNARGQVAAGAEYLAVNVNQQRPYIGTTTVEEEVEVFCAAEAWTGDPACKTVRDLCITLMAGVETVIRTDPTLAIDGSTIATLIQGTFAYTFDEGGNLGGRIPFTVSVKTTLTS